MGSFSADGKEPQINALAQVPVTGADCPNKSKVIDEILKREELNELMFEALCGDKRRPLEKAKDRANG